MCSIYENSTLTLCAADSRDSHDGLFRQSYKAQGQTISPKGSNTEIFISKLPDDTEFEYVGAKKGNNRSPLSERGWVLQERMLSIRRLFFGPDQLVWECAEGIASESQAFRQLYFSMNDEVWKRDYKKALQHGTPQELAYAWQDLVREYSTLALTRPTDHLPALSGLAKEMSRVRNSDYLAGLWMDSLHADLLWYNPKEPPPVKGRQPGWLHLGRGHQSMKRCHLPLRRTCN